MTVALGHVAAGLVPDLDHGDETRLDVLIRELQQVALAPGDVRRPCPGEAVRLLLAVDDRQIEVEETRALLDRVAVLVGGDHTDRRCAEPFDQVGQQEEVVVDDDVGAACVERVPLDGLVRDDVAAQLGEILSLGVEGVDLHHRHERERRTPRASRSAQYCSMSANAALRKSSYGCGTLPTPKSIT